MSPCAFRLASRIGGGGGGDYDGRSEGHRERKRSQLSVPPAEAMLPANSLAQSSSSPSLSSSSSSSSRPPWDEKAERTLAESSNETVRGIRPLALPPPPSRERFGEGCLVGGSLVRLCGGVVVVVVGGGGGVEPSKSESGSEGATDEGRGRFLRAAARTGGSE